MTDSGFLLDSNIVVWLDRKPERIPPHVLLTIASAPQVFLSAVTAWELGIKQALGDLTLLQPVSEMVRAHSMTELPVTIRHGEAVRELPLHHRDPFDRLLVAQALDLKIPIVSRDRVFELYGVNRIWD